MIRGLLPRLRGGETLTREETERIVRAMVRGEEPDEDVAAFLTILAERGETEAELLGGAEALRAEAVPFRTPAGPLLDTCGTGGDARGTFNISTAVAFVAAGAGIAVAKHGNRSVSSRCGSADVLEALGGEIDLGPDAAARVLEASGFTFLFARRYHPAVKRVAAVRERLGIRTLFNWIGPLANPAGASHQLVGVSDRGRVEIVARVLSGLGVARALVVHGAGGLDELGLEPGNTAVESAWATSAAAIETRAHAIEAQDLGLGMAPPEALRGGDAAENAAIIRSVLSGEPGPRRDAVILNAAAALWIAEAVPDLRIGVAYARELIDQGAAARALERYVAASRREIGR
ncbi:MAG: anthranilate phosphoribosyltransferase [Hyphomicrobiales bacterium]